jgi:hypothetical protein
MASKKLRETRREVECELDYGHFGNSRRVRDSNTGSQTGSIAGNEVASDALRLLHRVPLNGSFSYTAHEQIGRLSSSGVLTSHFKKWFGSRHDGYRLEIDYVEDADAWNEFLDGANLRELTFVARKPAEGNRAGRPTQAPGVGRETGDYSGRIHQPALGETDNPLHFHVTVSRPIRNQ